MKNTEDLDKLAILWNKKLKEAWAYGRFGTLDDDIPVERRGVDKDTSRIYQSNDSHGVHGLAADHREAVATYYEEVNRWIMDDGSGDWFGSQCYQDPERMK